MEDTFELLITNILRLSGLSESQIQKDDENMIKIKQAFVHKSYDLINNELLAVKGHNLIKYLIGLFINEKFPNISTPFQYSAMICKFQESKNYTQIALNLNLDTYIKYDPLNCKIWNRGKLNCDFTETKEYFEICGDVFVSLCYVLSKFINCNKFIDYCFSNLNISVDYENLVSPITRLNNLYNHIGIEERQRTRYFNIKTRDEYYDSKYENFTGEKIPIDSRIIGFGYVYDKNSFKLISAIAGISKNQIKDQVARELLSYYESINIKLEIPDTWVKII